MWVVSVKAAQSELDECDGRPCEAARSWSVHTAATDTAATDVQTTNGSRKYILCGCPFNGPLSGIKYPTRPASPIKYIILLSLLSKKMLESLFS